MTEKKEFQFIEIDALASLEEEFEQGGRPFQGYLMRKVLDTVAPGWRKEHPQYKILLKQEEARDKIQGRK